MRPGIVLHRTKLFSYIELACKIFKAIFNLRYYLDISMHVDLPLKGSSRPKTLENVDIGSPWKVKAVNPGGI